jgi:hypothetical protein
VQAWPRHQGGQALHEFQRRYHDVCGAVAIDAPQLQHGITRARAPEPLVSDRGAGDVATQLRFGSVEEKDPSSSADERPQTPLEIRQKFELEGDRQMTERWTIADLSESGLGAIAQSHGRWARVGMLVGFRRMKSLEWQMAIVRRLSRSPQGRLSIGLQTIQGSTWCGRLRFGEGDAGNPWVAVAATTDAFHDAIMLRGAASPTLLLEHEIFAGPGEAYHSFEKR